MDTTQGIPRRAPRGMTLIEIMVVITLLGLVAAAVGVSAMGMMDKGQQQTAQTQAMEIAKAVDTYRVMYGRYPSNSEGIGALAQPPGGGRAILDRVPRDPWGREYVYLLPGRRNPNRFDVLSHGADGTEGGGDDVGNWPMEAAQ